MYEFKDVYSYFKEYIYMCIYIVKISNIIRKKIYQIINFDLTSMTTYTKKYQH